jgi:phytoene dehydrogenase-like protein
MESPELLLLLPTLLLVFLTGITERGGHVVYKANVKEIITEPLQSSSSSSSSSEAGIRATGVRLADGRTYRGKVIVSNATRWDTFEGLIGESKMPESEKLFRYARLATHLQLQDDSNRPFCWC